MTRQMTSRVTQESLQNKWEEVDLTAFYPKLNKYIVQRPSPKQVAFLLTKNKEVLYGGAAGGGKSSALLMAALQYVDVPGYAAMLIRRTFKDLEQPGALMDRAITWLAPFRHEVRWDANKHKFTFPSGATLSFGYLESERDLLNYQGPEFQFVGFDELTQFKESQYSYLFSRIRQNKDQSDIVPLRMRAATNPGGPGHEWVKDRFIDNGRAAGRVFIPAQVEDNPALDAVEYEKFLAELDPVTRARLRFGDWDISEAGELFKREWFTGKYKEIDEVPPLKKKVRFWDIAATEAAQGRDPDWTAGVLMGMDDQNQFYILDVKHERRTPANVERLILETAVQDGFDVEIYIEQEPGASGKSLIDHFRRNILSQYMFEGHRETGKKVHRAKPFSGMCEAGHVYLVRASWNNPFLQELELFPNKKVHDDQVDAAAGAYHKLAGASSLGGVWF